MPLKKEHSRVNHVAHAGKAVLLSPNIIINFFFIDCLNRLFMLMKKVHLCLCLMAGLLLMAGQISAQEKKYEIKGKVLSSDNKPLEGVSITVNGVQSAGTVTDKNGQYRILTANGKVTLSFSYVGYAIRQEAVAERSIVDVTLKEEAKDADEVVVIGYQTVRRKDLVGAVASISSKDLKDIPVNSAAEALAGKLPGGARS